MIFGRGNTRVVIRFGGVVVKVAYNLQGVVANIVERCIWLRARGTADAPWFVPILWTCGLVSIQHYAGSTGDGLAPPSLASVLERWEVYPLGGKDFAANWRDEHAAVDYGFTPVICRLWCPKDELCHSYCKRGDNEPPRPRGAKAGGPMMPRPNTRDQHVPCPACRLMDYYVVYNEARSQSAVVCQNCGAPFVQIQYVPNVAPDPAVVI